jgi:predicted membrane chloride channel (bestrophin family)
MSAPWPGPEPPSAGETAARHLSSSVFPRVLPWALLASAYTVLIHHTVACKAWPSLCAEQGLEFFFIHPYAYQGIMLSSGFTLVFRLNQSYARYWEARSALQNAMAKWCDGVAMAIAFDEDVRPGQGPDAHDRAAFARTVCHLVSLLHACAMHALRGDDDTLGSLVPATPETPGALFGSDSTVGVRLSWLTCCASAESAASTFAARNPIPVLGGVTAEERVRLRASRQRVHMVEAWLMRLLVRRRQRGGLSHDAPIVSRIYQVLSDGNLWYLGALKVCDTPFPLACAQVSFVVCVVNLCLFPLIVADKVASLPLGACISFACVALLFALNEVARDLESPLRSSLGVAPGANRLDVCTLQALFNDRLVAVASPAQMLTPSWPSSSRGSSAAAELQGAPPVGGKGADEDAAGEAEDGGDARCLRDAHAHADGGGEVPGSMSADGGAAARGGPYGSLLVDALGASAPVAVLTADRLVASAGTAATFTVHVGDT